jgi:hypothetical protein
MSPTTRPERPKLAFSLREFCDSHSISESTFHRLVREGRGPVVMRVGGKILISTEAAKAWRKAMERGPKTRRGQKGAVEKYRKQPAPQVGETPRAAADD